MSVPGAEVADKAVAAAESVSRWKPDQGMMFGFVLLLVGMVGAFGWNQYKTDQAAVRHEVQQSEREANWTRFTESELEKGRQHTSREREKDRKALEDIGTTLKAVQAATIDLTKAVAAKKSIME